ncbi:MAG: efflux RND transporter periplasmic adaptor subunit [Clostridiales bacterium]|nr:efflux RND transporter periplasmic adaptor subunit [Clostridiales bacterium]
MAKKKKKNKTNKKYMIYGIPIILGVLLVILLSLSSNRPIPIQATFSEIHPTELVNSISVKGMVESVDKNNVYTSLPFRTKTVNVKTGDHVNPGQVLCVLDTEDLELSIEQLKAETDSALKASQVNLENAQRVYDNVSRDYNNNSDFQVKAAKLSLDNAKKNYSDALNDYDGKTDANVTAAESAVTSAKLDLDVKETAYQNNKLLYDNGALPEDAFTQSENLFKDASNRYNDALKNLETVKTAQTRALDQLKNAQDTAQTNYNNVVTSQERALEQAKNSLDAAQAAYDNTLAATANIKKLEKQMDDSVVRASAAGTVTAVFAEAGAVNTGLLFVIEDTGHLKIESSVREYDYAKVQTGMEVIIRSDSTGDNEYQGVVSAIDPAAVKDAWGATSSVSDAEFGVTVNITSADTPLRIGMNTRLELVLEKKSDVYSVRYDAVTVNDKGENIIFAAEGAGSGAYKIRQITVDMGMSNDFYQEITSQELKDGMKVMNDASAITNEIKNLNKTVDKIDGMRFTFV